MIFLVFFVFALDFGTKYWVSHHLSPGDVLPITSFFNIILTHNRGITFGLFKATSSWGTVFWVIVALAIIVFLGFYLRKIKSFFESACYSLIIGGAFGNIFDRITNIGVVDFIDIHWKGYHWFAFNVADAFICSSAVLIFINQAWQCRTRS